MINLRKLPLPNRPWANDDIDAVSQIDDMRWRISTYYWTCWE